METVQTFLFATRTGKAVKTKTNNHREGTEGAERTEQ